MSSRVKDTLVIKRLEHRLGRELTYLELDEIDREGFVKIDSFMGLPEEVYVPTYEFPYEMMPDYAATLAYQQFCQGLSARGNRWVSSSENRANRATKGDFWGGQDE
jgi:hypothetical protein